jgi:pimeloyl-ACP methyl ester carboxylesterase
MNTALATGDVAPSKGFEEWKAYVASHQDFDVGGLMRRAAPELTDAEVAAYDAPFPDPSFKAGVRTFPALVPVTVDMPGAKLSKRAALWLLEHWRGQSFMAVGVKDPVLGVPVMNMLRHIIPGCPEPLLLEGAGHFVQEHGDVVAKAALAAWDGR